jgi:hypothetical protein
VIKAVRGFYCPAIIYIHMLVFIDDSGDPGFKFEKGSTRYFVVLLLIFDDEADAEGAASTIRSAKRMLGLRSDAEIKFHESLAPSEGRTTRRKKTLLSINPLLKTILSTNGDLINNTPRTENSPCGPFSNHIPLG